MSAVPRLRPSFFIFASENDTMLFGANVENASLNPLKRRAAKKTRAHSSGATVIFGLGTSFSECELTVLNADCVAWRASIPMPVIDRIAMSRDESASRREKSALESGSGSSASSWRGSGSDVAETASAESSTAGLGTRNHDGDDSSESVDAAVTGTSMACSLNDDGTPDGPTIDASDAASEAAGDDTDGRRRLWITAVIGASPAGVTDDVDGESVGRRGPASAAAESAELRRSPESREEMERESDGSNKARALERHI